MSHLQPQRDQSKRTLSVSGAAMRTDALYHHYNREISWKQGKLHFSGYYGRYWCTHLGLQHQFLKRRLSTPGVYNSSNPFANMYNRFLDNRGIDWKWPNGQYQLLFFKWLLFIWLFVTLCLRG
jgi:hypothetical protein